MKDPPVAYEHRSLVRTPGPRLDLVDWGVTLATTSKVQLIALDTDVPNTSDSIGLLVEPIPVPASEGATEAADDALDTAPRGTTKGKTRLRKQ